MDTERRVARSTDEVHILPLKHLIQDVPSFGSKLLFHRIDFFWGVVKALGSEKQILFRVRYGRGQDLAAHVFETDRTGGVRSGAAVARLALLKSMMSSSWATGQSSKAPINPGRPMCLKSQTDTCWSAWKSSRREMATYRKYVYPYFSHRDPIPKC